VDIPTAVRVLRDQWRMVLVMSVLATVTGAAVTFLQRPVYEAQATIYVAATNDAASTALQGNVLSQQRVKLYGELVRSDRVMSAVVEKLGLRLSAATLARRVTAGTRADTTLLTITAADSSAGRARDIANEVARQFVELAPQMDSAADSHDGQVRLSVVREASRPRAPLSPQPVRNLGLAVAIGLTIGMGLAALRHILDRRLRVPVQVEEVTGAPNLGLVPAAGKRNEPVAANAGPYDPHVEALRMLRTAVHCAAGTAGYRTVLVTGALGGSGSTAVACDLAITIGRGGARVLLVDADLRRPRIARAMGVPSATGLTSVLTDAADLDEAVQPWREPNVWILPSGPIPTNPSELLGSRQMGELMEYLREQYDVVLLDGAPVLAAADAVATATSCDSVLLVVRYGATTRDGLRATVDALRLARVPVLGTVLVDVARGHHPRFDYRPEVRDRAVTEVARTPGRVVVGEHHAREAVHEAEIEQHETIDHERHETRVGL
jgi:capsular exopolysaccharide synthesis family protein